MIITVQQLQQSTLYKEICDLITRDDDNIVALQIQAAQSLCATYLFKYNLKEVFGDDSTEPATAPSVKCPALENIITIIACYYLVRKASPNVDVELYRDDYMQAIKLLEDIRDGHNNLTELHYRQDDPETPGDESQANGVTWSSNPKRQNFF
ncbi:MAG: DUF1320 family protein [Paludibacteraceae bacterium]|nr:DUF1320 family protein [Paludibacteraceae bacterium]